MSSCQSFILSPSHSSLYLLQWLKLLSFLILPLSPSSLLPLCLCCHLHRFFFDPLTLSFPLPPLPPHPSGDLSMTDAPDQPALTGDFDRHLSMVSGRGRGREGERERQRDYCLLTLLVGVYVDREGREGGDWGGSKEGREGGR